jgi:hypothetical protein
MAQSPPWPEAYFSDFDTKLEESPVRLKHFEDIEAELQGLDGPAWIYLKAQLAPLLAVRTMDKRTYNQEIVDADNMALMFSIIVMARANEESATKSQTGE